MILLIGFIVFVGVGFSLLGIYAMLFVVREADQRYDAMFKEYVRGLEKGDE